MTKLEAVIERLKALPAERGEELAEMFGQVLDNEDADFTLSPEQEAELARRMADPNPELIPHEEVFATLRRRLMK
jgi:putative addiction module component (TIGR02574 family)